MGEVWLARHLRLPGKQVAIKVLHTREGGLSADALARFRREAEVATRIGHPNIVEVHDYNTLPGGAPYLVLEFLAGESLASRMRFGAMPLDEVTMIIRQVGSALDASHAAGVVHRDLKPDNIFLVPTPMGVQIKVLDFGISKVVASSTLQTADEVLVGTPQYMSPEQATGQNKDVGPQTDVFALGAIAYEMLAGQPPFAADSVARIVFRIAYEPHVPLQQVKAGLPDRVYSAVEKALVKDRAHRHESIASFVAEFSGAPVPRTLPPPASSESSGVHRPGAAAPDSMAWGATAAPTPMPGKVVTADAPVVPVTPAAETREAPKERSSAARVGLAVAVLALAAGAYLLTRPPPEVSSPPPLPPARPAVAVPAVADAVDAAVAEAPAPVEDAGPAPHAEVPTGPKPLPTAKVISPADQEILAEMEKRLAELKEPVERVRQLIGKPTSPGGIQRAYGIAARAACKEHSLIIAKPYFDRITDRAERQKVVADCKKFDVQL